LKGRIYCFRPSPVVYGISITGKRCELQCGHCSGKYLSAMDATETPESLMDAFVAAKEAGAKCVLISGGFTREGKLPISEFMEALREGKQKTGLKVEIHAGVISDKELAALGDVGIDALLLDVIGDQETITDYMGGSWHVKDYERILKTAKNWVPILTPHILIGVSNGKIKGEFHAIDMVAEGNIDSLALLTLMDEYGTPRLEEVEKVMQYAKDRVKKASLTLGCMRSRGKERLALEMLAIDMDFDGIANPTKESMEYAKSKGMIPVEIEDCCVFIPK